jgi:hypothetical protein
VCPCQQTGATTFATRGRRPDSVFAARSPNGVHNDDARANLGAAMTKKVEKKAARASKCPRSELVTEERLS